MGSKTEQRNWIRIFNVSEPRRHKKGFTVYKVTSKLFPKGDPSGLTILTVWKRYKDFQRLHSELEEIHRQLYLPGKFPVFPGGKFFGRFDYGVVLERMEAALSLLVFSTSHFQLYSSKSLNKFLEDGYNESDLTLYSSDKGLSEVDGAKELIDENFPVCLLPERVWTMAIPKIGCAEQECIPPTPDIEETEADIFAATDSESTISGSVGGSDLILEPFSPDTSPPVPRSHSESSVNQPERVGKLNHSNSEFLDSCNKGTNSLTMNTTTNGRSNCISFQHELPIFPIKANKSLTSNESYLSEAHSVYIYEAAGYFAVAQEKESNGNFGEAFTAYKEGIRILLAGVGGDPDERRIALMKKKLDKYLTHAEAIHEEILKRCSPIHSGSAISPLRVPKITVPDNPNSQSLKASSLQDLKNYRIVGIIYTKIYVVLNVTEKSKLPCYAMKVIPFSSDPITSIEQNILPLDIPFMVKLLKWFETDASYILLLQFAGGGRLLDYVTSYERKEIGHTDAVINEESNSNACRPSTVNVDSGNTNGSINDESGDYNIHELIKSSKALITSVSETLQTNSKFDWDVSNVANQQKINMGLPFSKLPSGFVSCNDNLNLTTATTFDARKSETSPITMNGISHVAPSTNELPEIIDNIPKRVIPENCLKGWAAEMVLCLEKFHSLGLVYMDLAMHNILLGENGHILISCKGKWCKVDQTITSGINESSAPELVYRPEGETPIHPSCDYWSLGAILFAFFTGKSVYDVHPEGFHPQTVIRVPSNNALNQPISSDVRSLLTELLSVDPVIRLGFYGADEVKSHPCFDGFDWDRAIS